MVRKYREDLTHQHTRDRPPPACQYPPMPFLMSKEADCDRSANFTTEELKARMVRLKNARPNTYVATRKLCWQSTSSGTDLSSTVEQAGLCKSLPCQMREKVDYAELYDLDCRAADVLLRRTSMLQSPSTPFYSRCFESQSQCHAIETGGPLKSSLALVARSGLEVDCHQETPRLPENGRCPLYGVETVRRLHGHMDERHRSTMDDVARNFEEIERVLGESRFNVEQTSTGARQCNSKHHGKDTRRTTVPGWKDYTSDQTGAHSREEGRWSKHDEARETAAIKAAMKFLNKGIEHSNLLYDWLLGNPKIRTDSEPVLTRSHTPVIEEPTSSPDRACLSSSWHSSPTQVLGAPKLTDVHRKRDKGSEHAEILPTANDHWHCSKTLPFVAWEYSDAPVTGGQTGHSTSRSDLTTVVEREIGQKSPSEGHWLEVSRSSSVGMVRAASIQKSKGSGKTNGRENHAGGSQLEGMDSLSVRGLEKEIPVRNEICGSAITTAKPASAHWLEDPQQLQSSRMQKVRSLDSKSGRSLKSSTKHKPDMGHQLQNVGLVLESGGRSCLRSPEREDLGSLFWLEADARQSTLAKNDMLTSLESSKRVRASLAQSAIGGDLQVNLVDQGERANSQRQQVSHRKRTSLHTPGKSHSCCAEKVIGRTAESENYRGVLATLEHCHKENFCQRSLIGPGEQSVLSVVKNCQRTGKRQVGMHLATSQQYRTGISKGIKEKEGRSLSHLHGLNVRKPPKWRAVSTPHSRLRATAASYLGGRVVVEELEEMALGHACPRDASLLKASSSTLAGTGREERDFVITTGNRPVRVRSKQRSCLPVGRSSLLQHNDNPQPVQPLRTSAANISHSIPFAESHSSQSNSTLSQDAKSSEEAQTRKKGQVAEDEKSSASTKCGDVRDSVCKAPFSYTLKASPYNDGRRTPQKSDLQNLLPRVLTIKEGPFKNNLATEHVPRVHEIRSTYVDWPELDSLISQVICNWMEKDKASSVVDKLSEDKEGQLQSLTECARQENVRGPDNLDHDESKETKTEDSEYQTRNLELAEVEGKICQVNSVAALASLLRPLAGPLQGTEMEVDVVREFGADETVRLLLEKLHFYENKIRALKRKGRGGAALEEDFACIFRKLLKPRTANKVNYAFTNIQPYD